ncbi:unnamed protein product [Periconia digitata]|uniref:RNA helicase n=1 Tax=Periconia digitata TaxID=1303443 RepID=A0A9W4UF32_9PLEO|nr:unnamed protein product [Periconia digitata]
MPKFVPRQRKHKVLARQKLNTDNGLDVNNGAAGAEAQDANALEILPAQQREREERKQKIKDELVEQQRGKMSGKKKKRLDKYIDTKLKKEENLALLKKLAAQKIDTSLFRSSTKLGRAHDTKRETLRRALAETKAGIDVEKNESILLQKRKIPEGEAPTRDEEEEESDEDEAADEHVPSVAAPSIRNKSKKRDRSPSMPAEETSAVTSVKEDGAQPPANPFSGAGLFGGGLKRPLELDDEGKPIIQTRKRRKGPKQAVAVEEEVEWEGFSSDGEDNEDEDSASGSDQSDEEGSQDAESLSNSDESETSSGEESDSDSQTSSDGDRKVVRKERASAFKAWATQQRNEAVGFVPTNNLTHAMPAKPANFTPRAPEQDPLPAELQSNTATDTTRKAFSVTVDRTPEIQEARLQLPVVAEEQKIMEAIHNNDVVVVWGATGSGKTTQVPQFLYESGYGAPDGPTPGMIGVTQPRRVAAVSMAKRVGDELGSDKNKVAHQIRFDTTTSAKTAVKFMTDGVLLREISQDFVLTKYSAIVIDEAHERSVNTDILIGMLSRIVDLRAEMARTDKKTKPLKLIIMSATLRISDFTDNKRLFRQGPPPLMKAEGRQFTVTNHFARRTQRDYVEEMFKKVCRGHRKLPKGGMLVFLTGQNEIAQLSKRLKEAFSSTQGPDVKLGKVQISAEEAPLEEEDLELQEQTQDFEDDDGSDSDGSIMGADNEDDEEFDIGEDDSEEKDTKVHVLPLYSQLSTNQQLRVFEPPPDGSRLIVLATNVAETSLTIPGVRYVFDCGRAKEKKFDRITGVQSFEIGWISKASANQRAGRAGRTGPGHCYRLYSSAVFERDFEEYAEPEIMRTPLEGVVLQLRSMGAPVVNFPFPTPPDRSSLQKAENLLSYLGALSPDGKVTKLGQELSLYPLNPRFARMLVMGLAQNLAPQTIALVSALSVPELFVSESKLNLRSPPPEDPDTIRTEQANLEATQRSERRKAFNAAQAKLSINANKSDCIKLNNAVCAYAHEADPFAFCSTMFLNSKALNEASQLRQQLTSIVRAHRPTTFPTGYSPRLPPPSSATVNLLTQICAAGFIDHVAMRADLAPSPPELPRKPKTAIDVPYITLFPSHIRSSPKSTDPESAKYVFLHPSSLLNRTPPAKMPGYIIYSHLQRASNSLSKHPKTRFHPLTPITRPQLINIALGTPLLEVSKPKGKVVDVDKECRECEVEMALVGGKGGGVGWGLGVRRVLQRKDGMGGWRVEKVLG